MALHHLGIHNHQRQPPPAPPPSTRSIVHDRRFFPQGIAKESRVAALVAPPQKVKKVELATYKRISKWEEKQQQQQQEEGRKRIPLGAPPAPPTGGMLRVEQR